MFDSIGWTEMMVVGVVALIVVGPKDLPKMFHAVGEFTGKARGMAREFQRAMNVAAKEAGVDGLAKDFKNTASGKTFKDAMGFDEIDKEFRDIGRIQPDVRKPDAAKSATSKSNDDGDEADADVAEAAAYDADMAARNSELTATEVERLKKAERSAAARQKAAAIRADNEAQAAEAEAAKVSATAEPKAKSKSKTKAKSKAKSKAKAASDTGNSTESQS